MPPSTPANWVKRQQPSQCVRPARGARRASDILIAMSIRGLHIPHDERPLAAVAVNERNAMSYYPFVQGGPVEAGHLSISGLDLAVYVNSRYLTLDESMVNERASALFEMAGVGIAGGAVRGDALVVRAAGTQDYERSLPTEVLARFIDRSAS